MSKALDQLEEVDGKIEGADPITILRSVLESEGILDEARLNEMDAEARRISQEAFDFADESPLPDPDALYRDVYAEINPNGRLFFDARERPGFAQ